MKKTLATVLVLSLGIASSGFAAPLDSYEKGKVALDLGFSFSQNVGGSGGAFVEGMSFNGIPIPSIDSDNAFYGGVTVGLGGKFALQGRYDELKVAKVHIGIPEKFTGTFKLTQEKTQLNLLYKMGPHVSPYIGWKRSALKLSADLLPGASVNLSNNAVQVGIIGHAPLSDKATAWVDVAIGTKNTQSYELGIGYKMSPNFDFNVGYQYNQSKYSLNLPKIVPVEVSGAAKIKTKGWFAGVTYKF